MSNEQLRRPGSFFLAFEGNDATGKATQIELLRQRLLKRHVAVALFAFPRYTETSSHFVRRYLAGQYGNLETVNAKTASLFFALDRYDAKLALEQALSEQKIVLADRFTASNLAHQGARLDSATKLESFLQWALELEFETLAIPRPNLNLILDIPVEITRELLKQRTVNEQQDLDLHEQNYQLQQQTRSVYLELQRRFPEQFRLVNCLTEQGVLMDPDQIAERIWQIVAPYLMIDSNTT